MSGKFPDDKKEKRSQTLKISTENQTGEQPPLNNEKKRTAVFTLLKCATGTKSSSFPISNSSSGIS